MPFAQLVIGPPGSGKTTYCNGMHQFLNGIGRPTIIVNLDPANENIPYDCAINIQDLVSLEAVMEEFNLGPNGGMIYCLEYLEKNLDWLKEQLKPYVFADEDNSATNSEEKKPQEYYVLFDCPGQVELYTHHDSVKNITEKLQSWGFRLTAVHLVDAHYCSDASKFISVLLVSLSTMVKLELPHINVLSKVDLIQQYGKLPFDIEYFTDVQDLSYLVRTMESKGDKTKQLKTEIKEKEKRLRQLERGQEAGESDDDDDVEDVEDEEGEDEENEEESSKPRVSPSYKKFVDLNRTLSEVIEDFSLVSFLTLNIQDKQSVYNVLKFIDKSNGYIFGALENLQDITHKMNTTWNYERFDDVRRKYLNDDEAEVEEEEADETVDKFFAREEEDDEAFQSQSIEDVE